jgi:hypothetical protein
LQVGDGFHLLFRPDVAGGLQKHDFSLVLQGLLGLFSIDENHSGKGGVYLRVDFHAYAQQCDYDKDCPSHFLFPPSFYLAVAALRHLLIAIRATSPLFPSSIPAVTLFHTSVIV